MGEVKIMRHSFTRAHYCFWTKQTVEWNKVMNFVEDEFEAVRQSTDCPEMHKALSAVLQKLKLRFSKDDRKAFKRWSVTKAKLQKQKSPAQRMKEADARRR